MRHSNEYRACIDTCLQCAATCEYCAASCLQESDVKMLSHCIELDLACASICHTAAKLMSLDSHYAEELCRICVDICNDCGNECEKHIHMEHCRRCAEICFICADECRKMAGVAA